MGHATLPAVWFIMGSYKVFVGTKHAFVSFANCVSAQTRCMAEDEGIIPDTRRYAHARTHRDRLGSAGGVGGESEAHPSCRCTAR